MKFIELDRWFVDMVQEAYLWLYDWTGIYVATIEAILLIIGFIGLGVSTSPVLMGCLGICLISLIRSYLWQDKKLYKLYNAAALRYRDSLVRYFCQYLQISLLITDTIQHHESFFTILKNCGSVGCLFLVFVLNAVCIREREPKEWFRQLQWAPTT